MDIILALLGFSALILGIIGCFLPVIPGPPLGWLGLLLLHITDAVDFSNSILLWSAIAAITVTIMDYVIPIWGTRRFGGTRWGVRGSTIGLVIGLFLGPLGIILGPFAGALIAELLHDSKDFNKAFRSAIGSFVGFLLGVGLKLSVSIWFVWLFSTKVLSYNQWW